MIKATGKLNGRDTLFIGLSFRNLDHFRAGPGDSFIHLEGSKIGLPVDLVLFSGITEADCVTMLQAGIGVNTKVEISKRQKN
jgi:hypothetical protein